MNNFQKEILFDSRKKSKLVAYLLGAVLGGIGGHRLYLKEYKGACAIILLLVLSLVFPIVGVIHVIFVLIDFFLTWGLTDSYNKNVRKEIEAIAEE